MIQLGCNSIMDEREREKKKVMFMRDVLKQGTQAKRERGVREKKVFKPRRME